MIINMQTIGQPQCVITKGSHGVIEKSSISNTQHKHVACKGQKSGPRPEQQKQDPGHEIIRQTENEKNFRKCERTIERSRGKKTISYFFG